MFDYLIVHLHVYQLKKDKKKCHNIHYKKDFMRI